MSDKKKLGLGTAPVFLTAISTILGAVLFLRFGYAVGNVGFWGSMIIILLGHLVTIPTSMAIAEIATNKKVEGGGEYFIISRSFGLTIGGTIGIALYLSQAISVAFYIIAFGEAFIPVLSWLSELLNVGTIDKRFVTITILGLFAALMLTRGANSGVKVLYVVVGILFMALLAFFIGESGYQGIKDINPLTNHINNPDSFFVVFAIIFPAFTGMTAGVGLSGDLAHPRKSIPLGTIGGTLAGMVMYVFISYKMVISASPDDLVNNTMVMADIAVWGPIIPIGLACATLSSALGSIMVAPRTLQALGKDKITPFKGFNNLISFGKKGSNEPIYASIITLAIALFIIVMGDIDFVAKVISMFFMITYGSLCLISFLQHFASSPSYRPTFKSQWYISLIGAITCMWLMFKMDTVYALLALIFIFLLYITISRFKKDEKSIAALFQGAIFQLNRALQVFLQRKSHEKSNEEWRPSVVSISKDSFDNFDQFNLLRWISERYGFGTYIHLINGYLSSGSEKDIKESMDRLMELADVTKSNVFINTLISPSYTSAIAQAIQLPGISGKANNMLLFSYSKNKENGLDQILENLSIVQCMHFDIGILATSDRSFGFKREIQIWMNPQDYINANLMILLGYIISGHKDWKKADIKINVICAQEEVKERREELFEIIEEGRLAISSRNINIVPLNENESFKSLVNKSSHQSDLSIIGFQPEKVKNIGKEVFCGYDDLSNILFVNTSSNVEIS